MRTDTAPMPTLLSDYTPPSHELTSVYLDFDLQPSATTVKSKIEVKRLRDEPLVLNGENISLKSVTLDGTKLKRTQYTLDQETLTLQKTPESFTTMSGRNEDSPRILSARRRLAKSHAG